MELINSNKNGMALNVSIILCVCVCVLEYDQEISLPHVAATPIQPCSYIQRIM